MANMLAPHALSAGRAARLGATRGFTTGCMAWKERFGEFRRSEPVELQLANQQIVRGEACGPVQIRMEGFRPVFNEAVFPDSADETPEPLLGYVILEQAQAAVDMVGHRLVPVRYIDLK